jgi:hypothetical protein
MHRSTVLSIAAALASAQLLTAQPAQAQKSTSSGTSAELMTKARKARLQGDVPNWLDYGTRTLALVPGHPDILISVARANAAAGNKARALDLLAQAVHRGAGIDPVRFAEFKPFAGDPRFQALAADGRRNLTPVAKAVPFADLPERGSEGIAYDPASRRFFVGTDRGELLAVGMDGKVTTFASGGGLRQVLGIKVDAGRRLLWLANGRYPEPGPDQPPDSGTGGVRAYHLETGALVSAAELDERPALMHGFNDIALAQDGTVYVTDSNTAAVYKQAPGGKQLKLLLRDDGMSFPNGIVISSDGHTLYVAHAEGISALDPATGSRRLLPVPADASVHSIDGLLLRNGVLYGVQNSPYMHRIVGAALARDGRSIDKVWTVNSRTPGEYMQTTAAIAGNDLYMIGGRPMADVYGGTNAAKPISRIWRVRIN